MKYLLIFLAITLTSSVFTTNDPIKKLNKAVIKNFTKEEAEERMLELENRVFEIEQMDLSTLERSEIRALRKETRYIHKEMKSGKGGIYISTGAIIIILLLVIIL